MDEEDRVVSEFLVCVRLRHRADRSPEDVLRGFIASCEHTHSPHLKILVVQPPADQEEKT